MLDKMVEKNGLTEKEILNLCSDVNNHPFFRLAPYWTAEIYSFGKYIRKYGYYPSYLPLAIYTDHGAGRIENQPYKNELENDAPYMFYHSPESVKVWQKFSKKPCSVLYSPFVFCRKINQIEKSADAKGTIAFPTHSTADINNLTDVKKYIEQLKALPEKFQPISVSLHISDIKKNEHRIYLENGIPVYTAGGNNDNFAKNFYNILKNFSYATSNLIGSCTYYSVEMGVPFFIYGDKPELVNAGNENIPAGKYDFYAGHDYYQRLHNIFSGLDCEITSEKKTLIETDLGLYEGVSRLKMTYILYTSLFKWIFSAAFVRWVKDIFRKVLKSN